MTSSNPSPIGAIVTSGIVQSLIYPHPDGFSLEECYPPGVVTPVPDGTNPKVGMTYADGKFGPAPVPPAPPSRPRAATVAALLDALSSTQRGAIPQDDRDRLLARAIEGPVSESSAKVVRAAKGVGLTPSAWFDAALA